MFLMGFYRLPEGTHEGFDKHRSGFFWNLADNKKNIGWLSGRSFAVPSLMGVWVLLIPLLWIFVCWSNGGGVFSLWNQALFGWVFLKQNISLIPALYLPPRLMAHNFGDLLSRLGVCYVKMWSLWLIMGNRFASGSTGGMGMPLLALPFLLCFRSVGIPTLLSIRWLARDGIWTFDAPWIPQSSACGTVSLPHSLCFRMLRILSSGLWLPLASFRWNLFTVNYALAPRLTDFLISGEPVFHLRLRSFSGKRSGVNFLRLIKSWGATLECRLCVLGQKILTIFFFIVILRSCYGVVLVLGVGLIGPPLPLPICYLSLIPFRAN